MAMTAAIQLAIDYQAIGHNTRLLASHAAAHGATLMCVVKADGYNHGAVLAAHTMAANGAAAFGVATIPEALQLRDAGITQPILAWLWDSHSDYHAAIAADIDLAVISPAHARLLKGLGAKIAVKVDTGLNRSGVDEADWPEVFHLLKGENVTGVFSHLAAADDPADPYTDFQAETFNRAIALGRSLGFELPNNHLAASSAAVTRTDLFYDSIRPGLVLYGLPPLGNFSLTGELVPAATWRARIPAVKRIFAGEAVSYGHTWEAPEDGYTAVVPIGYADGMPRAAQGKIYVSINGHTYPQIGRICMDQFVVWLGDNPHGVQVGDWAIVFGSGSQNEMTATEIADAIGTINYEVVCSPKGRTVKVIDTLPSKGEVVCATVADTQEFAAMVGRGLQAGDVVILDGPLGAGKTAFTQGLAEGMQVSGRVTSPTFVIAREHRSKVGGPDLVHVDAYRLLGEDPASVPDPLGALDSLDLDTELDRAVVVAEWGGGLVEAIASSYLKITIDRSTLAGDDPENSPRIISWEIIEN